MTADYLFIITITNQIHVQLYYSIYYSLGKNKLVTGMDIITRLSSFKLKITLFPYINFFLKVFIFISLSAILILRMCVLVDYIF
uniref:Uncharacterized protein n=1 Tax=Timema tahoe TaxID=61484 RepID=A0A7R9IBH1_9NEOP|nr:unnamed protein product [Timema tahoe]